MWTETQPQWPVFESPDVPHVARILLVEDDASLRALLAEVLRREGYGVDTAADGDRAARALFLDDAMMDYDLIVSDVRMPGMNGVALASHVQRELGPPVLLVSAFATPDLVREGIGAGAVDVIAKPFALERLLDVVRRLVPPDTN